MPMPSVTLCRVKPSDQEDAEGGLAEGEGGADGQPLAEVVQADAERDRRWRARSRAALPPPRPTGEQQERRRSAAPPARPAPVPWKPAAASAAISWASSNVSTTRKSEQPDGQREDEVRAPPAAGRAGRDTRAGRARPARCRRRGRPARRRSRLGCPRAASAAPPRSCARRRRRSSSQHGDDGASRPRPRGRGCGATRSPVRASGPGGSWLNCQ